MSFWEQVDGALLRQSVRLSKSVRQALIGSLDPEKIAQAWFDAYAPKTPMTKIEARIWAKMNIALNDQALYAVLGVLYATGYVFGKDVAGSAYAHAISNKAITEEEINQLLSIDWSKWEAGNHPAEALARPKGALKKLLEKRGLDLEGLNNTTLDRIGTQLANALKKGSTIELLADAISSVVSDPERALTISNTSMASAMSVATLETYQEFGLQKMRWLALEPCDLCQANASAGPVTPGQVFPSGNTEPPAHPNCRCALMPVIDLNPSMPEITLATDPDLTKFDPNQSRDDRGRFASNGVGGAVGPALQIPDNNWVDPKNNLVSATAPYVGLSDKARDVASRISDVKQVEQFTEPNSMGDPVTTTVHKGTYEDKAGTKYTLYQAERVSSQGWVEGKVYASAEDKGWDPRDFSSTSSKGSSYLNYNSIDPSKVTPEVPFLFARIASIGAYEQGVGMGTALLEFGRKNSTVPILHSRSLTEDGNEFAESTKNADLPKFDPSQPRDDRGRFSSGGGSAGIADTSTSTTAPADYRMRHQAPTRADDFGSPAYDVEEMMPDFYEHPEWYRSGDSKWDQESVAVIQRIKGNPDAPVTLYRGVPKGVEDINQGDWVTLSRSYAQSHIEHSLNGEGHIISIEARARDLWFDGNSINEFGYDPDPEAPLDKFSQSQPRDSKGRFASSGIAGWEKAEPDPQERGDLISKAQTRWQTTCAERGLQTTPEEMDRIAKDVGAKYDRQFEEYDTYRQGNLYLEVDRSLPEGTAQKYAENIAGLKEKFPLQTDNRVAVVVTSNELEYKTTVNGFTASSAEGTVIALSPTNMSRNIAVDLRTDPMPARNGQYYEEFTLAHEWGHAYDLVSKNAYGNVELSSVIANNKLGQYVSGYGKTSNFEQYAEVFAQSYMESKYPDAPKSPITPLVKDKF